MGRTLKLLDSTGTVAKKAYSCPFGKKMSTIDELYLLELVIENPAMYLTEVKKELQADESTICRFIEESNFSRKKMKLRGI